MTVCAAHGIDRRNPRRYPLEPVAALFPGLSLRAICGRLKISGSTYEAYVCHGVLPKTADRIAARVGVPAYYLWPEMIDDLLAEAKIECVECGDGFVPTRKGHIYCSEQCGKRRRERERRRHRWANDPAWRAQCLERNATRYVEEREYRAKYGAANYRKNRAARLVYQADYYQRNRDARISYARAYRARKKEQAA